MDEVFEGLSYHYNLEVESAYIITLKGHAESEAMAQRCIESCIDVGQSAQIYDAFDGTSGRIIVPDHSRDKDYLKLLKMVNFTLTPPEVCCLLSHYALWCKCVEMDRPIVILEHDAVMLQKYTHHNALNNIVYLGSGEQVRNQYCGLIPIHAQISPDFRYIYKTHAYAIDPMVARNLASHLIKYGITTPVDCMIRADLFPIVQHGIFAQDLPGQTTIPELFEPNK
jgi:glycosyl transferase family 25